MRLAIVAFVAVLSFSCASDSSENSENIRRSREIGELYRPDNGQTPDILQSPRCGCRGGRARRAGEPVVVLHQDDYYLFITGGRGYWYSDNMRDWTYVDAPDFPGGCPSVVSDGETIILPRAIKANMMYLPARIQRTASGKKSAEYQRDYGDADMFIDDDGRYYMYWGWSQILPFQVVELDPENGFKEKGEPVTLFFRRL